MQRRGMQFLPAHDGEINFDSQGEKQKGAAAKAGE